MKYEKIKKQYYKALDKFKALGERQKAILFLVILVFLAVVSLSFYFIVEFKQQNKADDIVQENNNKDIVIDEKQAGGIPANYVRRRIDGFYVDSKNANNYPMAVMIDNDPNARPQSGLARAQVVYEAKAESGITRFLAIFANGSEVEEIGPVRSARPYFIDWASGYDALYIHVGGSPEALNILKNISMLNLNEFYQGGYFWRSESKFAPHNVYTSIKSAKKYLEKLNVKNNSYDAWQYKQEADLQDRGDENIAINFSVNDFLAEWKYDKENNEYIRYMSGALHKDADGTQIKAKNIIIMKVPSEVLDEELRRKMSSIGEGKAWYCFDGGCNIGKWKKTSAKTREKIYHKDGEEIKYNAGTTWIEVVQYDGEVSIMN